MILGVHQIICKKPHLKDSFVLSGFTVIATVYHRCLDQGKYEWFSKTIAVNMYQLYKMMMSNCYDNPLLISLEAEMGMQGGKTER